MPARANRRLREVPLHGWDVTPTEAVALQQQLRERVITTDAFNSVSTVAGVDVGFESGNTITRAAVVVLDFPSLKVRSKVLVRRPTRFPYIPGLLTFRELPAVLEAFQQLDAMPDLVLYDGQGIAHPRRFGIAAHLGVWLDLPVIGAAKSRLIGTHDDVPSERGAWRPLHDRDECIGAVLRTRTAVSPLYISIGHRISLETAIDFVLACAPRYRLPETTRAAHALASEKGD